MGSFLEWYLEVPVVTRFYMTSSVLTTAACSLELLSPFSLYFNFHLVFMKLQLWRLLTNFFFFGSLGVDFLFHMFFLVRYGRELEAKRFEGRAGDMLWMMMATGLVLVGLAYVMGDSPVLSQQMLSVLVYLWSRENSEQVLSIFGLFNVQAFYFPWVLMAMHVLMGGSPIADLVGIGSGHCYYFATDVQGYELRAPSMLRNVFDTQSPAQQRIANRQNAFGGHQWGGGGQRLGG